MPEQQPPPTSESSPDIISTLANTVPVPLFLGITIIAGWWHFLAMMGVIVVVVSAITCLFEDSGLWGDGSDANEP
jgi:hypothetical protein